MVSKMSSLMDLVSQNQPHFKTHQALLVIGMQNDFIQPDGRLPVSSKTGYLDRIQTLIPKFRKLNGNVIWVQTLYEGDRIANDASTGEGDALVVGGLIDGDESSTEGGEEDTIKDLPPEKKSKHKQRALDLLKRVSARRKTLPQEVARATAEQDDELFLLRSEKKAPACVPDTLGAQFADVIAMQFELPADMVIKTSNYSAFQGTSLLMTLRAKLVTELYICGCITNVSVLATVIDAARHGVKINVIEDCLGFRKQTRHELALKRMDEFFDAYLVKSTDILAREPPATEDKSSNSPSSSRKGSKGSDKPLEAMVGRLSLNDSEGRPSSRSQSIRSPTKVMTGGQRKLSLVSVAESRKVLNSPPVIEQATEPTDKEFADNLVRGAIIPGKEPQEERQETKLVTKKIRMRSKGRKKKKKPDEEAAKDVVENGESSAAITSDAAKAAPPVSVTPSAQEPANAQLPAPEPEPRRASLLSRAESVLNLRDKMSKQQSLKSVASQPALSAKADAKEKERDRDSWSDRMRMSLSRAPKSESSSDKNRLSYVSTKGPSTPSKAESRPASIAATIAEVPPTPTKVATPVAKDTTEAKVGTVDEQPPATKAVPEPAVVSPPKTKGKVQSLATLPVLGPGDNIGEGDASILHDFFPADLTHPTEPTTPLRDVIFTQLYNEVRWQKMHHQSGEVPRLVCCQGEFGDDGSMPIYRHPSDESLPLLHFSPKVQVIRKRAEKLVGHPLNHVLIQLYRSGSDFISEHSDKTLDIVRDSSIVNVSFGAQRTMRLRTKRTSGKSDAEAGQDDQRTTQRIHLPHNSLFTLGQRTNATWLHGIQPDKRISAERSSVELAYNGVRISLTFRHIGTFLDARSSVIWGQGATSKDQRDAADVVNGDEEEGLKLIKAFSSENSKTDFAWNDTYGDGFDVLHLHTPPSSELPILFASHNSIETTQARLALWELKIPHDFMPAPTLPDGSMDFEIDRQVTFRDTDQFHTEVQMSSSILLYLDRYHKLDRDDGASRQVTANAYPVMLLAAGVLKAWFNHHVPGYQAEFETLLDILEDRVGEVSAGGGSWVAGKRFSIADLYVWPIVEEVAAKWEGWDEGKYVALSAWWKGMSRRKGSCRKVREEMVKGDGIARGGSGDGKKVEKGE